MSSASRRAFILSGALAAVAAGGLAARAQPGDPLQAWLQARTVPVRAIDGADGDFADLEPLADAIGSARVVQLGEPSHGSGSAFAAKARLTRFLHRRLGFDVLIWESGFYDVALAQAAMRSGDDALTAAGRGVFALWSLASQVRPLFEYVKASQATPRPLEMAGFDLQVTADGTTQRFAQDLREFVAALRDSELRSRSASLADRAIAARQRLFASRFADEADMDALAAATGELRASIGARRPDFERVRGALETAFMERAIENMRVDALQRFEGARSGMATTAREGRRDALNAANLRWLLEARYPGRKAVVWAHNAHIMNAGYAPGFRDVHPRPLPGDMKPTGVFLKDWLGDRVYTLGITAFQGEEAFATGGPTSQIPPAPDGSLEARLHALGHPYAFLDYRASRDDRRNPMRSVQTLRLPKFDSIAIADVGRIYDGVLFIDRMSPATRG